MRDIVLRVLVLATSLVLVPAAAFAGHTHALFGLDGPDAGPFPSDRFTVSDGRQLTGVRIALPLPDCQLQVSECEDLRLINTLDGFNLSARLSIPFDGPIDLSSVTGETIFLIELRCVSTAHHRACHRQDGGTRLTKIGINQAVWDPFTNVLHVESDELLEQHTRYALIVTTRVRDAAGLRVRATRAFRRFRSTAPRDYQRQLAAAMRAAHRHGVGEQEIAAASVFTTQSVTTTLEQMRDRIKAAATEPADFLLAPGGGRAVFPLSDVTGAVLSQQTGTAPTFTPATMTLAELRSVSGAVGTVAFGRFLAPDFQTHPGEIIETSRRGAPVIRGYNELYFNLVLPAGPTPPGGWPVAISAHGAGSGKESFSLGFAGHIAAELAARGLASIHINLVGHGFGPLSTLTINRSTGLPVTISAGGRGRDQNGDGLIQSVEGRAATPPFTTIEERDGIRQSVADLMQLVRVIQAGVDVNGDAQMDLDPTRISFFGQSFGAVIGTVFMAVEPDVSAGAITAAGGPWPARVISPSNRVAYGQLLARRVPSLINAPGVTHVDGVAVPASPAFNELPVLRDGVPLELRLADGTTTVIASPAVNAVAGAAALQTFFERAEWIQQSANPVAWARHLRASPLRRIPEKRMLFQFARGDQVVPNPLTSAMLRAGGLADRATLYRNDLAILERPTLPKLGHGFAFVVANFGEISRGAQHQIATFLASGGEVTVHPEPGRFFEVPVAGALPEDLGFIR